MKTTLTIDDDALQSARRYATANGIRLGKAVSLLIKQAVSESLTMRRTSAGFLVYDLPPGSTVTSEMVRDFRDEIE